MSFGEAIQTVFRKYAEFTGRATRPEFWWALFNLLVAGALNFLNVIRIGERLPRFPARRTLGRRGPAAEPRRGRPATARRRLRLGPPVLDPGPDRRDLRAHHPLGTAHEAGGAGDDRRDRVAAGTRSVVDPGEACCPWVTVNDRCYGHAEGTAGEDQAGSGLAAMASSSTGE
jgi:hypothetical protein